MQNHKPAAANFVRLQGCVRPATEHELRERAERGRGWKRLVQQGICHTCHSIAEGEATSNPDGALSVRKRAVFRGPGAIPARPGSHDPDRQAARSGHRRAIGRVGYGVDVGHASTDPRAENGNRLRQSLSGYHVFRTALPSTLSVDTEAARRTDRRRRLLE